MRRIREGYNHIAVGAKVVISWHGKEREGIVFHRVNGSGLLHVRLLDNNSTPPVPPERYVCTLEPEETGEGEAENSPRSF